jgi:hypothetical protein
MVLLELYPCSNKRELHTREREWQENTQCTNYRKAILSPEERANYYETFKDKIKLRARAYYQANSETIKAKVRDKYHARKSASKQLVNTAEITPATTDAKGVTEGDTIQINSAIQIDGGCAVSDRHCLGESFGHV